MATIPIEVIVQDKASPEPTPTPTPSDSGETNIVVPDTGAGTVENGSNGGGIGSTVNIILPAIVLVLAIGAIVALLIRRQQGRKNNTNTDISKKEKLVATASGTIAILAATVLVGNLVIPATKAATNVEPGTAELDTVDKITITATRETDSDITVATAKDTSYATANLDFGYKVTASMIEGATTANLYLNGDETSEYYIAPVEDGALTNNTWGYTLEEPSEDATYLSIPLEDTPTTIVKGNGEIEDEAVDIYYAIKVDKDLPAGSYKGELEYTLTDNNFPATLTTMQGMTTEICENTFTPGNQVTDPVPTATLEDIRDHKTYTIAKLADGKCWMTQNLDLAGGSQITAELSDVPSDYNLPTENGFQNGNKLPDSALNFSESNMAYVYNSGNTTCDEEIPCYSYYSWVAATAGSGLSLQAFESADYSICPANWKLPSSTKEAVAGSDFYDLAVIYGMNPNVTSDSSSETGANFYNNAGPGTAPNLTLNGGYIYGNWGGLGITGRYWSSTVSYGDNAINLFFENGRVNISDWFSNKLGFAIRCIAR